VRSRAWRYRPPGPSGFLEYVFAIYPCTQRYGSIAIVVRHFRLVELEFGPEAVLLSRFYRQLRPDGMLLHKQVQKPEIRAFAVAMIIGLQSNCSCDTEGRKYLLKDIILLRHRDILVVDLATFVDVRVGKQYS